MSSNASEKSAPSAPLQTSLTHGNINENVTKLSDAIGQIRHASGLMTARVTDTHLQAR